MENTIQMSSFKEDFYKNDPIEKNNTYFSPIAEISNIFLRPTPKSHAKN